LSEKTHIDSDELAHHALKRLKAACKGNGVKSESIGLGQHSIDIISFEAQTVLKPKPEIKTEKQPGTGKTPAMGSAQEVDSAIKTMLQTLGKDPGVAKQMTQALLDRPDKGFFLDSQTIPIQGLKQDFSYFENCSTCSGNKHVRCQKCQGRGHELCPKCHGKGLIPCLECHGSGFLKGPDGQKKPCFRCSGQRQMPCDLCRQSGEIACRVCKNTKQMTCQTCKGTGGQTVTTHVSINVETDFSYQRDQLPKPLIQHLEEKQNLLVKKGELKVEGSKESDEQNIKIVYEASCPYGDIHFTVKDKPVTAQLFGYKGALINTSPFLDIFLKPGIKYLEAAASANGSVSENMRNAAKYRAIAYALLMSVKNSEKGVLKALRSKFPIGISDSLMQETASASKKAFNNITKKPKWIGLALGIICACIINGLYFLIPLRQGIETLAYAPVIDLLIIPVNILIVSAAITAMIKRAFVKALGHIIPAKKRNVFQPKLTGSLILSVPAGIISYAIFLLLTLGQAPAWVQSFLG